MVTLSDILESCRNIYAIGRNYHAHAEELNNPVPTRPLLFQKSTTSLCSGSKIQLPKDLGSIHHEIEIIMRIGQNIPVGQFRELTCCSHIGLGIDFTARDLQGVLKQKGHPWLRAKSFKNATYIAPLKPFAGLWQDLTFQLSINDVLVQDGDTRRMIFSVTQLLSELNAFLPLIEGDLIFTGTPAGVGPVQTGDILQLKCADLVSFTEVRVQ